jgi:hypothetical protein
MFRQLRKVASIILIWLVFSLILLEILLRLAVPFLPLRLRRVVDGVNSGVPFSATDIVQAGQFNADHFNVMSPGVDNLLVQPAAGVRFHISTITLFNNPDIGFRTRPIDYFVETVVTGDSMSFCYVEFDECWVRQFETETGLGTVNLAQMGTGARSHLRMLQDFAQPLTPRLVIWQFYPNDFGEDYMHAMIHGETPELPLAMETMDYPERYPLHSWLRDHSALYAVVLMATQGENAFLDRRTDFLYTEQYTIPYGNDVLGYGQNYELYHFDASLNFVEVGIPFTEQAMQQAEALVESWGGHLIFVVAPVRDVVYRHVTEAQLGTDWINRIDSTRQVFLQICQQNDLLCLDPTDTFSQYAQAGEMLYFTYDAHFNVQGNARLAQYVWEQLGARGLLYAPATSP